MPLGLHSEMEIQNRKSFIKTLGILTAGTFVTPVLAEANNNATSQNISPTAPKKKRVLRVAHLTDIHIKPDKIAEQGLAEALNQVNTMADKPDFIINGGDTIMNAGAISKPLVKEQWACFHKLNLAYNKIPMHHCIGNHDLFGWALPGTNKNDGKKWALDEYQLSNPYYSFFKNGWKFIILDSIHPRKSVPGYFGKLDDEQLNWLENELAQAKDKNICVVTHIPILAVCTLFDSSKLHHNNWFVPDNTLHADAYQLRDLFFKYKNVKACLSGHIHLIDYVNYLGTDYYCNGAVSGAWWKGDHQQFSPSFIVMNFYDDGTSEREIHYYNWKMA